VAAWAATTLVLVAWFIFSAWYLYGIMPEDALREALKSLTKTSTAPGLWGKAEAIFLNNIRVLLLAAVPGLGLLAEALVLAVTAAVGRFAAELIARLLGGSWWTYFWKLIVATPFFPLEMLAYGIAVAEGLMLLRHRSLSRYLVGVAVAVAVLAVAAVVEAYTMTHSSLSSLVGSG